MIKAYVCTAVALFAFVPQLLSANETTTYVYDALGRLQSVSVTGGTRSGVQQSFQYDGAGNRRSVSTMGPAVPRPASIIPVNAQVNVIGNNGTLSVSFGAGASGSAGFYVNGQFVESVDISNNQARVSLRGFAPGDYSVSVSYSGDASHDPSTTNFMIRVRDLSWLPAVLQIILE
jgi:hypothetical protein